MTSTIEKTPYFDDFLSYFGKAKRQQELCNLGTVPHAQSGVGDALMENVFLYDVVERKYAGFGQILNDVFYGWSDEHPYWEKMKNGLATEERKKVASAWTITSRRLELEDWAFIFLVHRITGSAINYSRNPSGYFNTVLPEFSQTSGIDEMVEVIRSHKPPKFTSIGYQFPQFPKPPENYRIGGDYYLCEFAPELARSFSNWLRTGKPKTFREMGEWALNWNVKHGLKRYRFQYAAWVADFADFFPEHVDRESPFYYGTNAVECLSYLARPVGRMKKEEFLDEVMFEIYRETGSLPYDAEDCCCDYIRFIEGYIKPGGQYDHLDRDKIWPNTSIVDHPFGRQKAMLDLGLIGSFNDLAYHPSDDAIIKQAGISINDYKEKVRCLTTTTSSMASTKTSRV